MNKIHPLTEIIALCAMAFPQTNEWVQDKICRCLVGKNIIKPTDEYVDKQENYMRKHHPDVMPTRNSRILAPRYALYLATTRALQVLGRKNVNDVQKVICSLPFSVASRQDFPLDVILLDEKFVRIDSEAFSLGIIRRIKQDELTFDQKSLLMRSAQIMIGNCEL